MIWEEFKKYKHIEDKENPFSDLYELPTGEQFYIEPAFMTQLHGFKEHYPEKYQIILDELIKKVLRNKKVIFTSNFECPQTEKEEFVILEITDITDPLQIFVEDKSRGSDYGD